MHLKNSKNGELLSFLLFLKENTEKLHGFQEEPYQAAYNWT
jgi:hypothetical protein